MIAPQDDPFLQAVVQIYPEGLGSAVVLLPMPNGGIMPITAGHLTPEERTKNVHIAALVLQRVGVPRDPPKGA